MPRKLIRIILLALSLGFAGAAHVQADDLVVGIASNVTSLDPHFHYQNPNSNIAAQIFDRLIAQDERQRLVPALAESWRNIDDKTWEFKLRKGVTFHDGSEFTADDVVASINRIPKVQNSPSSYVAFTKHIAAISIIDPHLIRITTDRPWPLLPTDLSVIFIINKKYADAPTTAFNSGEAAIGTGPFKFRGYRPGEIIELDRNDKYWQPPAEWEHVAFRIMPSDAARVAALLAGDVQIIDQVPTADLPKLRDNAELALHRVASNRVVFLYLDQYRDDSPFVTAKDGTPLTKNPLKDVRVRRAISLAVNRAAIAERLFNGEANPAGNLLPPGGYGVSDRPVDAYDPEAAKRLLAEAGYAEGFKLTIHAPSDRYPRAEQVVQAVAAMLQRVGIATAVEVMPWATYAGRASAPNYAFSAPLGSWGGGTGEISDTLRSVIVTVDPARGTGGANRGRYSNKTVDEAVAQAMGTLSSDERAGYLVTASDAAIEDQAIIPLYFQVNLWASRKDLAYRARADEATLAIDVRKAGQ